jgi:hypothetical protein
MSSLEISVKAKELLDKSGSEEQTNIAQTQAIRGLGYAVLAIASVLWEKLK